jgi:hypothetical protein
LGLQAKRIDLSLHELKLRLGQQAEAVAREFLGHGTLSL